MKRAYYSDSVANFLTENRNTILGHLVSNSDFAVENTQRDAWTYQIKLLKELLVGLGGTIYFEYSIPRMGKRVDVLLLIGNAIFVVEFKVGDTQHWSGALNQVTDYALDLKNFHDASHDRFVVPILIATEAKASPVRIEPTPHRDGLLATVRSNGNNLGTIIREVQEFVESAAAGDRTQIESSSWENGKYLPTPTIIEAAMALYNGHSVAEISRSDASGAELHRTTDTISTVIENARAGRYKAICFVTGVPGAGKTLIGLNIATRHLNDQSNTYSVFLSGNGPLVQILQEALARDKVARKKAAGRRVTKSAARSEVKTFIQNVHHYRDEYLKDSRAPADHVALFDEAQRAWDLQQTSKFMRQKKNQPNFNQSEPEFLISCIDRHKDWGVIVCLVGGGQEINTGEAGIAEWIEALNRSFPDWHIHISDRLTDSEYGAGEVLSSIESRENVHYDSGLHLSVSMRSFRAENVSRLVKEILDLDADNASQTLRSIRENYPIVLTRDLAKAKAWLRQQSRGSERYGIVVSSQANRLKPLAIDVRLQPNPIHWFLAGREDVRSSYYLEDVATEFDIQGLELDWACVTWDADFRHADDGWVYRSFRGNKWQKINKAERQSYLKNAYRVLLTRARQGMVVVVPEGDTQDPTRDPAFYDSTYDYLRSIGLCEI
ncbi:DUF2075 domain-containing protein [Crateriforma conspicua]|uniref:Schlafen group 3-like DNA/RNA helicase domain-containing protein n=1 Tax=Crateriforma conspicua TaxID=2527996 RepID=A0A5C5Y4G5_9PLAN|nr:DUF2075 domain-containing protein [Crateriforma conspicua]TWT69729.1 hypothetical protein Pan14r_20210 [Crateriforma conspicua]